MLVLPAHTTLLQAHEHDYSDTEKVLRIALRFLLQHSAKTPEERNQVGYAGLNEEDMRNPFFESLSNRRWSLTPAQMRALYQKLTDRYVTVLLQHNITLPEEHAVAALFEAPRLVEPGQSYAMRTRPYVDVRGQYIFVTFPHPQYKSRMDALTARIQEQKQWCRYTSNTEHEWQLPLLPETFALVLQYFPLPTTELSVRARSYKDILDARLAHSAPTQTADAHTLEYRKLLAAVNNLEGEIAPGVTLYPHQKEVVRAMLWRHYFLCGDETGLGKTFPAIVAAKALHVVYGYKLYVVSTKSSLDMWQETAALFDLPVTVYGWGELLSMTFSEGDTFTEDFTLIADEVHYAKNFRSKRTQKYLDFTGMTHCKAHYGLSGTLSPNGRPVEVYNGLFAVRHPLVYSSSSARANSLKNQYLDRFCNRHRRKIGTDTYVWDINGASEVPLWNSLVVYTPGSKENHQHACMIARLKTDVTDLPEKRRVMLPVSMSPDATKVFRAAIEKMWKDYNAHVEEKVVAYKLKHINAGPDDIAALRARMKKAYALVSAVFLRHAGAIAKVETTLEYARMIASRGSKLVIFTYFTDVAKQVGAQLAADFGPESVGYILGEMSRDERTAAMRSFQDKTSKTLFIISTSAGGESITLTTAQHMLIVDRTWSAKDVKQWEDRIHRMTTTGIVTIYWLQLPKELTEVDITIDNVLQGKQVVIDLMQFNKTTTGMAFIPITNLKDQAETLLYTAYMQSMKRKGA